MTQDDRSSFLLPFSILGILLMIGMIVGGLLLGTKLRDFKRADRYVEVKGLVERTVKSDSATWPLSFSEAGDSLPETFAASEKDKAAVLQFLNAQGFAATAITLGQCLRHRSFPEPVQQQHARTSLRRRADHHSAKQ